MPTTDPPRRRQFLTALGTTGAFALAGCLQAPMGAGDGGTRGNDAYGAASRTDAPALEDPKPVDVDRIAADPTAVPPPVDWSEPRDHVIDMETVEVTAEIEPGVTFEYMTFDGRVPGPLVRVRRGDRIRFRLTNPPESDLPHNMDFHAVYGPGGGAAHTTITPGETAEIEFRAMSPGVFIYHCAVPNLDQHISAGMFGAILVEPEAGLPAVDRELYFGQHELYTSGEAGQEGHHAFDFEGMQREEPTYVVFNGEPYAFTPDGYGPLAAGTDERIRIYFANGGPNLSSSWHAIGNVWTRLYRDGDLLSDPARYVETTPVAPGTVAAAQIDTPVPGPIKIVDHALTRAGRKGALAIIDVDGEADPDVYDAGDGDTAEDVSGDRSSFDGWLADVDNYDGIVDRTGRDRVTVAVGAPGNGGNYAFDPPAIRVDSDTTVVWEWTGAGGLHDVAHEGGAFESELTEAAGNTFEHPFGSPGTFKYACTPHADLGMKGVVLVE